MLSLATAGARSISQAPVAKDAGDPRVVLQRTRGVKQFAIGEQIPTLAILGPEPFGLTLVLARMADTVMDEKDEKPEIAKVVREQLNRSSYRDALRSRYKPIANDAKSDDLLKRLAEKEPKE